MGKESKQLCRVEPCERLKMQRGRARAGWHRKLLFWKLAVKGRDVDFLGEKGEVSYEAGTVGGGDRAGQGQMPILSCETSQCEGIKGGATQ